MKQNGNYYVADEGKTFIRKADGYDMGEEMWLGEFDTIDNYEENGALPHDVATAQHLDNLV